MKVKSKEKTEETEVCELNQRIWGVIDGVNCLASDLTYSEAAKAVLKYSGKGAVVTNEVAAKLPKIAEK